MPEGIREAIGRRRNRLTAQCNDLLTAASAIGRQFDVRELSRIVELAPVSVLTLLDQARAALAERGEFRIALSGGNTPRPIYAAFGRMERECDLAWERVRFTFGDERCVPPGHTGGNYRRALES